ncbi:MAG: PilZ domain-containing protein [Lysobacteraceae bacterium]
MNAREADVALFGDALACDEVRPAGFEPATLDPAALHAEALRAEAFLQALALVEDSRGEDAEEHAPVALALQRIEARLDLLTALVGSLLHGPDRDPPRALRWSALGARLEAQPPAEAGGTGWLRLQPSDALPQVLRLPVRVLACADLGPQACLWLRFEGLTPALAAALERHLFRVHRREIAERRRR